MFLKNNNYGSNIIRNCSNNKFCPPLSDNWLNYQLSINDEKNKNWIIFEYKCFIYDDKNRKMVISRLICLRL